MNRRHRIIGTCYRLWVRPVSLSVLSVAQVLLHPPWSFSCIVLPQT